MCVCVCEVKQTYACTSQPHLNTTPPFPPLQLYTATSTSTTTGTHWHEAMGRGMTVPAVYAAWKMPSSLTRRVISEMRDGATRLARRRLCTHRKLISTIFTSLKEGGGGREEERGQQEIARRRRRRRRKRRRRGRKKQTNWREWIMCMWGVVLEKGGRFRERKRKKKTKKECSGLQNQARAVAATAAG